MKLPQELKLGDLDLIKLAKRLVREIGDDDISGSAAELAYRLFLAIFPFFIFLAALGGFLADLFEVSNPTQQIMDSLGQSLPPDASSLLERELESVIESRDIGLVSIGIIGAVFAASSGVATITKALNRIYGVRETRSRWKRYALALGVTFIGGTFLIGGFMIMLVGQLYGLELARDLGIEGVTATIFAYARWPLVTILISTALAVIYWSAPNLDLRFRLITPGAAIATLGWLLMTLGFGFYVSNFGSYNATYGALGGVVIALVWFYLTGFVVLLGAEINSVLAADAIERVNQDPPPDGAAVLPLTARGPAPFALLAGLIAAMFAYAKLRR